MTTLTLITLIKDLYSFEICEGVIYLCEYQQKGSYINIKSIAISSNPKYVDWLIQNSETPALLEYYYINDYWFVDMEQNDFGKYLRELKYHIKRLGD